jgi:hypothetical protein
LADDIITDSDSGLLGVGRKDNGAEGKALHFHLASGVAPTLAAGASTSAKQDTGNTSLAAIASKDFATSALQTTGNQKLDEIVDNLSLTVPAANADVISPSDETDLANPTRGLYVGVSGDVKVDFVTGGSEIVLTGLMAGVVHPLRVKRVYVGGTTATEIIGLY